MKKFIFMALALCAPTMATAQEPVALCYSIADYGQSVMQARRIGMTQSQVAIVRGPEPDPAMSRLLQSIERVVFSLPEATSPESAGDLLFNTCVNSLPTSP